MSLDHAVVVGGSFAGLVAARALSDHFDRVWIIERDELPATRRRVLALENVTPVAAVTLRTCLAI
jgi:phytoene dehydrogenase-like protein